MLSDEQLKAFLISPTNELIKEAEDELKSIDKEQPCEFSDKFKKRMNRLFREQMGGNHALHPEVDNTYERIRSRILRLLLVLRHRLKTLFKEF